LPQVGLMTRHRATQNNRGTARHKMNSVKSYTPFTRWNLARRVHNKRTTSQLRECQQYYTV